MDTHIRMHTYIQDQPTYTIGLGNIRMFWLRQAIMSIALSNAIFLPSGIAIFLPIRSQGTGAKRPRSATSACPRQCPCRFSLAYSVLICKATGGATDGQGQGEEQEQMG